MENPENIFALIGFVGTLFFVAIGVILTILWIAMPFAVFGIKKRLDNVINLLAHLIKQNEVLHPELRPKIDNSRKLESCSVCQYFVESTSNCKKTGWNIHKWKEKNPSTVLNPCDGKYFEQKAK